MSHWKHIHVGMKVMSPYFGEEITVVKINADDDWYFEIQGHVLKAHTKLSNLEKRLNKEDQTG